MNLRVDIDAFVKMLKHIEDYYSPETSGHEARARQVALEIGRRLNSGERLTAEHLELLGYAADLHDWGKIFIDSKILRKKKPLESQERDLLRLHAQRGFDSLKHIDLPYRLTSVVLFHHEHFDGSGYPRGLSGLNIPLFPRIICIADVYDALVSQRPYRAALTHTQAIAEMRRFERWFDPKLFAIFLDIMAEARQ